VRASVVGARLRAEDDHLPKALPRIELRHGEALWVLSRLGFQGAATKSTFYEYIKSLRKLGTPFEPGEIGRGRRSLANYSYRHLMELALALTLRVYHVVPDSILVGIIRCRRTLYRHYGRAYADRCSGLGAPISVKLPGHSAITVRGVFLDLRINFSGGTLTTFGPPQLLSPREALSAYARMDLASRALLPINLSLLAERVVSTALRAPRVRTGPRPSKRRGSRSLSRIR